MGNCMIVEEKVVRVMKSDGKIIEYKHPIKAHQILSQFSDHAISKSNSNSGVKHMHPNAQMLPAHLYYLLPLPPVKKKKKKTVRFSDEEGGVVRIKVVMRKTELLRMLSEGDVTLVDHIISKAHQSLPLSKGCSPALHSIPELEIQ